MKKRVIICSGLAGILILGIGAFFLLRKEAPEEQNPVKYVQKSFPGPMLLMEVEENGKFFPFLEPLSDFLSDEKVDSFSGAGLTVRIKKLASSAHGGRYSIVINDCGVEFSPLELDCEAILTDKTLCRGKNWYVRLVR